MKNRKFSKSMSLDWYVHLLIFSLALILSSCASTTVDFSKQGKLGGLEPTSSVSVPFFIGGLFPEKTTFETSLLCETYKSLQKAEVLYSGMDVFLTIVTLNLYSPKTVRVWCI